MHTCCAVCACYPIQYLTQYFDLTLFYNNDNIYPESAVYLGGRDVAEIAKSTNFNCKPDAILVSGLTAGVATDNQILSRVKAALPDTYVFCNTGCRPETIKDQLAIADGAIVGTTFKKDGKFDNFVDYERVVTFMEAARARRQ